MFTRSIVNRSSICGSLLSWKIPQFHLERTLHTDVTVQAGHSHWQNIKHTKQAKDKEKSSAINAICNEIRAAIRETGISDPKLNRRLAVSIEKGKKQNLPMAPMERAIKKAATASSGGGGADVLVAFRGPKGSAFIAVCDSEKPVLTKHSIQHVLKKFGLKVEDNIMAVMSAFDRKGLVTTPLLAADSDTTDPEDVAISVGAEDVTEASDADGRHVLEFVCDVSSLHKVKTALTDSQHEVEDCVIGYRPRQCVSLTEEECAVVSQCLNKVYDNPEVVRVYDNIE